MSLEVHSRVRTCRGCPCVFLDSKKKRLDEYYDDLYEPIRMKSLLLINSEFDSRY